MEKPSLNKLKQKIKSNIFIFISIVLFFFLLVGLNSAAERLKVDNHGRFLLGSAIEYFENTGGYDFETIRDNPDISWKKSDRITPNFGFTLPDYWFRFKIDLPSSREKLFLEIAYPLLDYIELYQFIGDAWDKSMTGDMRPFSMREVSYRNFLFEIDPQSKEYYYIHVKTESSLQLPLYLWNKNAFVQNLNNEAIIYGVYFGILIIMFFYNLFIYLSVRERVYLYYVAYILAALLAQLSLYGFSAQFIWTDSAKLLNWSLPFFLNIDVFFGVIFCVGFLNLKIRSPFLYRVSLTVAAMSFIGIWIVFFGGYALAMKFTMILLLVIPFLLSGSGLYVLLKGAKTARFFLMAWIALLAGMIFATLGASGIIKNSFLTDYSVQIGTALEVVLLSLALADRINIMKEEYSDALRQKLAESEKVAMLSDTFRKFVPINFLEHLQKDHITQVVLGDHVQRDMTILFADIRGFTTMSENMTPEENFNFINSYLGTIGPIIRNHGGFIDKYIGDGIMALFPESPGDAVKASIQILNELSAYNEIRQENGNPDIEIGIGINTGSIMLGIIGESERMDGTVISDAVNLSSRIEGLTKVYGVKMIVSENVFSLLSDPELYANRFLGHFRVKGKNQPVSLFEIFETDKPEIKSQKLEAKDDTEQAIFHFNKRNYDRALELFQSVAERFPEDTLASHYLKLIKKRIEL